MAFTEVLAKATRKAGIRVERSEELALFVVVHDNALRCNLATVYNAYRQSPERLDDIVAAHLAALAKVPAVPAPPNAAELRTHLLPMLNQRSRLTSLQQPGLPAPLHRTFPGNLVVTYVFDQSETMAYVNPRMLKTAGATALGSWGTGDVAVTRAPRRDRSVRAPILSLHCHVDRPVSPRRHRRVIDIGIRSDLDCSARHRIERVFSPGPAPRARGPARAGRPRPARGSGRTR